MIGPSTLLGTVLFVLMVSLASAQSTNCQLPAQVGSPPQVSCNRACCDDPNRRVLSFRMDYDYPTFDCAQWIAQFQVRLRNPSVCSFRAGSAIVEMELDTDVATAAFNDPGAIGIPNLLDVTDPVSGAVATAPASGGLPMIWIIVIILLFVLLILLIVLIVLCCMRKNEKERNGHVPLREVPLEPLVNYSRPPSNYGAPAYSSVQTNSRPASASLVSCRMIHSVEQTDDTIVPAREGDIVFVLPEDFADTGEWVWVKAGTQEGYVPRSYLLRIGGGNGSRPPSSHY